MLCIIPFSLIKSNSLESETFSYPLIHNLTEKDPVFRQWQLHLKMSYKTNETDDILFFTYRVKEGDNFLKLSSKMNGWQATLATLNGLSKLGDLKEGSLILLPTRKGVFISQKPKGSLQELMSATREISEAQKIFVFKGNHKEILYFYPFQKDKKRGEFNPSERYFFLDSRFHFPLKNFTLSSGFGWRKSPISGKKMYHKGIDLAAEYGTLAYPTQSGQVILVGNNAVYGKYVIVKHSGNYQSLYGHFRKILVKKGDKLSLSDAIGEVGDTGMATGPHLHFEIYKEGQLQNPSRMLGG